LDAGAALGTNSRSGNAAWSLTGQSDALIHRLF